MTPNKYFPDQFLKDQEGFQGGFICDMQLSQFSAVHDGDGSWPYLEHFLVCEYELNLLDEAIYTYFREDHAHWKDVSVKELKLDYCHGPIAHPIDILARCEQEYPQLNLHNKITKDFLLTYDQFFWKYLEDTCANEKFKKLTPERLRDELAKDTDNNQSSVVNYLMSRK